MPHLARQKDETLGIIRARGFGVPTLLAWAYNDPTASLKQGHALFDLIARATPDARMMIFNRAVIFLIASIPRNSTRCSAALYIATFDIALKR